MLKSKQFLIYVIILSFLLVIKTYSQRPIRIGIDKWTGTGIILLAEKNGYFIKENLRIDLIWYDTYENMIKGFVDNEIDALQIDISSAIQLVINDKHFITSFCTTDNYGFDEILAQKKYTSIDQLEGKKIAFKKGTIAHYLFLRALENNGLQDMKYFHLDLDFIQSNKKFVKGEIDAMGSSFLLKPPNISYNTIYAGMDMKYGLPEIFVFNSNFINRKDDVRKIMKVWNEAVNYYRHINFEKSNVFIREKLNIADSTFFKAFSSKAPIIDIAESNNKYFNHEKSIALISIDFINFFKKNLSLNSQQLSNARYFENNLDSFFYYINLDEIVNTARVETNNKNNNFWNKLDNIWGLIGIFVAILTILITSFIQIQKHRRFKKMLLKANDLLKDYFEGKETSTKVLDLRTTIGHFLENHYIKEIQYNVLNTKISEIQTIIDSKSQITDKLKNEIEEIIADGIITEKEYHHLIYLIKNKQLVLGSDE